jgi:hypothetical protein
MELCVWITLGRESNRCRDLTAGLMDMLGGGESKSKRSEVTMEEKSEVEKKKNKRKKEGQR